MSEQEIDRDGYASKDREYWLGRLADLWARAEEAQAAGNAPSRPSRGAVLLTRMQENIAARQAGGVPRGYADLFHRGEAPARETAHHLVAMQQAIAARRAAGQA